MFHSFPRLGMQKAMGQHHPVTIFKNIFEYFFINNFGNVLACDNFKPIRSYQPSCATASVGCVKRGVGVDLRQSLEDEIVLTFLIYISSSYKLERNEVVEIYWRLRYCSCLVQTNSGTAWPWKEGLCFVEA